MLSYIALLVLLICVSYVCSFVPRSSRMINTISSGIANTSFYITANIILMLILKLNYR